MPGESHGCDVKKRLYLHDSSPKVNLNMIVRSMTLNYRVYQAPDDINCIFDAHELLWSACLTRDTYIVYALFKMSF